MKHTRRYLLAAMMVFLGSVGRAPADLTGWAYRSPATLSSATGTNGYQVRIDLTTGNFNYAHADAAGKDLRFADPDALQSLGYWVQGWSNTGNSTIWVKVPNAGTTNLWIYYGNPNVASESSGTNTFLFFDDFTSSSIDTNTWVVDNATGWSVVGGELKGTNTSGRIRSKQTFTNGAMLEVKSRTVSKPAHGFQIGGFYVSASDDFGFLNHPGGDYYCNNGVFTAKGTEIPYAGVKMLTRISVISGSQVNFNVYDYDSGASLWAAGTVNNTVSSEPVALGCRFDNQFGGVPYEAYWDWIRVRLYAAPEPSATVGAEQTVAVGAPAIDEVGAVNVDSNRADLVANLVTGTAPVTVSCYWGTSDGGSTASAWMMTNSWSAVTLGYQTNSIGSGLQPGTKYYFRYYATNSAGAYWAPFTILFSTLGSPTVDNAAGATGVGQTTATLNGTLDAGNPAPNVWIYWGTNDGGTTPGSWNLGALNLGVLPMGGFSTNVIGLVANQSYWYRGYATNDFGGLWASASTNFTTFGPTLMVTPVSGGVIQSASGPTSLTYTVSLSTTSAVDVSVQYATANGTATAANNGYVPTNGTATIPAGSLTTPITVSVLGTNAYKLVATFYVNFSNALNATVGTPQVACTITNINSTLYVRGDGNGSDSYDGSSWSHSFATLQYALNNVPYNTPFTINVQASVGAQSYATCARSLSYNSGGGLNVAFQGGWTSVDAVPIQSGVSTITSPMTNQAGIFLANGFHSQPFTLAMNNFSISNVTMGVICSNNPTYDHSGIVLSMDNCTLNAQSHGVCLYYPKWYGIGVGGPATVLATNVNIVAGLGGAGDGIHVEGIWIGSTVTARGIDPTTGAPRVSAIRSLTGNGVYLSAPDAANNSDICAAVFSNLVVYGCASNSVHLDCAYYTNRYLNVRTTLQHCTIADNGANGLDMLSQTAGSWACVSNCIFAGNAGQAMALNSTSSSFTCNEGYNVMFNNGLLVNGLAQSVATNTSTADPIFYAQRTKPYPWYLLSSAGSPAYLSGSDGSNRGAYQDNKISGGTMLLVY